MTTNTYSAIHLLEKVFEFIEMTPNPNEWNLKALKANSPRQIRFRQIDSLLKAFGITDTNYSLLQKTKSLLFNDKQIPIASFLRGDFIKDRSIADYSHVIQFIRNSLKDRSGHSNKQIGLVELALLFQTLIEFKKQIRQILTFNSGWIEASSDIAMFSIYLTNTIAENLTGKYHELDNALEQLINPQGLTWTENELIEKFNFPTEVLSEIDMDFM